MCIEILEYDQSFNYLDDQFSKILILDDNVLICNMMAKMIKKILDNKFSSDIYIIKFKTYFELIAFLEFHQTNLIKLIFVDIMLIPNFDILESFFQNKYYKIVYLSSNQIEFNQKHKSVFKPVKKNILEEILLLYL